MQEISNEDRKFIQNNKNSFYDYTGELYSLRLSAFFESGADFERKALAEFRSYLDFPNALKYSLYSEKTRDTIIFEDEAEKEKVVCLLKKIFGIKDPWDDDPQYFNKKL